MCQKVIIIEDDTPLRTSIAQSLELANLEPIPTNGFTQARRSIRSNFAGVILSDIQMPDHSGFDVLDFARNKDPELPVILLTGHSDVPTAMKALKSGAYEYLEKPCEPTRLVETLKRALDHRKLVLENRHIRAELETQLPFDGSATLHEALEETERRLIEKALIEENGKVIEAAQSLGIPRNTLYDRMAKFGLVAKAFRR